MFLNLKYMESDCYVVFCNVLFSLNNMFLTTVSSFISFLCKRHFSTRNGLVGRSQFSAIINNATMNIVPTLVTQMGTDLEAEFWGMLPVHV